MRRYAPIGLGICVILAAAGLRAQTRYAEEIFPEVTISQDVLFGANANLKGEMQPLRLDCYQPSGDTFPRRPLLIWMHGGGFVAGSRDDLKAKAMGAAYAKRGYVAASIDYRVGIADTTSPVSFLESMLRAVQDGKAALRFFRKHAALYRVDTARVFVGGSSAGGVTALLLVYWDQDEVLPALDQVRWGNLEGSSGNPGYPSHADAALNCWGAIPDTNWIDAGEPPVACFHGMLDRTVPYDVGVSDQGFQMCGSAAVCRAASRLGIYNELSLHPAMKHGVATQAEMDSVIRFTSRFLYRVMEEQGRTRVHRSGVPPRTFRIEHNYPNPFNGETRIRFSLRERGWVRLTISDIAGKVVATPVDGFMEAGEHTVRWDGKILPSGVYLYSVTVDGWTDKSKMALVK